MSLRNRGNKSVQIPLSRDPTQSSRSVFSTNHVLNRNLNDSGGSREWLKYPTRSSGIFYINNINGASR